jgi:hypothetical protein
VKQFGEQLATIVDAHLREEAARVLIEPVLRAVPYGIIDADLSSMGMDAQWFGTLERALRS